ncbi:MAG: hypothetical protein GWN17_12290 [Candidatus Korarchaeota archaeon]|nr:hypothetical protein [Candidatus Thorarchaeota archaeon]NIW52973.1 hypothetical protein [Candidatus Korarchaeota archaeon]
MICFKPKMKIDGGAALPLKGCSLTHRGEKVGEINMWRYNLPQPSELLRKPKIIEMIAKGIPLSREGIKRTLLKGKYPENALDFLTSVSEKEKVDLPLYANNNTRELMEKTLNVMGEYFWVIEL